MKEKEPQISKGERLKKYLADKERTEVLLLDLLRQGELQQQYYNKLIEESDKAYYRFLSELKKQEKEDNQLEIPFNQ